MVNDVSEDENSSVNNNDVFEFYSPTRTPTTDIWTKELRKLNSMIKRLETDVNKAKSMRHKIQWKKANAERALNLKNLAVDKRYEESKELLILNLKRALRNSRRLNSQN